MSPIVNFVSHVPHLSREVITGIFRKHSYAVTMVHVHRYIYCMDYFCSIICHRVLPVWLSSVSFILFYFYKIQFPCTKVHQDLFFPFIFGINKSHFVHFYLLSILLCWFFPSAKFVVNWINHWQFALDSQNTHQKSPPSSCIRSALLLQLFCQIAPLFLLLAFTSLNAIVEHTASKGAQKDSCMTWAATINKK
jgi:hypothetical protein